jgi:hypothetical protein
MNRTACVESPSAHCYDAGGLSASAFATCTSTLVGLTATVTCDAATDDVQIGEFFNAYFCGTFGSMRARRSATTTLTGTRTPDSQYLEGNLAVTINVHLAGGSLTLGIPRPPV